MRLGLILIRRNVSPSFDYVDGRISNVTYEGLIDGMRVQLDAVVDSLLILSIRGGGDAEPTEITVTMPPDARRPGLSASYGHHLVGRLVEADRILERISGQDRKRLERAVMAWEEAVEVLTTWVPSTGARSASLTAPTPWGPLRLQLKPHETATRGMAAWLNANVKPMHELRRVLLNEWTLGPAEWNEHADGMGRSVVESMRTMSKHPEAFRP